MSDLLKKFLLAVVICLYITPLVGLIYTPSRQGLIQAYAPYTRAMYNLTGSRVCSSVTVDYFDKTYTVTNAHCCVARNALAGTIYNIGGDIVEMLLVHPNNDICVLTSNDTYSPIAVLPRVNFGSLDDIWTLGYPWGQPLTPLRGHVLSVNTIEACMLSPSLPCWEVILASVTASPGSSGSPVFDSKGRLIGVINLGNASGIMSAFVPLKFIQEALRSVAGR